MEHPKVRCTDIYYVARENILPAIREIKSEYNNRFMYVNYGACLFKYPDKDRFTVIFVLNKSYNEKKIVVNQFKQAEGTNNV